MTDRRSAMLVFDEQVFDEQLALLGRIARIVHIATICGEPFDQFDHRIAVARLKSDDAFNSRRLSMVSLDGVPSLFCSSAVGVRFFILQSQRRKERHVELNTRAEVEHLGPTTP